MAKRGKSTIQLATAKYAQAIPSMKANYVSGVSRFLGTQVPANSPAVQKYNMNLPADGQKWAAGVRRGFGV
jgi:hypothetical protein